MPFVVGAGGDGAQASANAADVGNAANAVAGVAHTHPPPTGAHAAALQMANVFAASPPAVAHAEAEPLVHAPEPPGTALSLALECARRLADGPTFAHGITKKLLHQEWAMGLDEAIEHEAQAQAICMQTKDFKRAYRAFAAKEKPEFKGN